MFAVQKPYPLHMDPSETSFAPTGAKKPQPTEDFTKYSYFPVKYPKLEEFYQAQKNMFWTAQEIDYGKDREDWDKLDADTKRFIKFILCFFAQADGIVNENLIENFKNETSEYKEARWFYAAQEFIEVIHNEAYSMLIEAFIRDPEEKAKAFNAISHYPSVRKITDWAFEWMNNERPLTERMIAFACVEGIFFMGAPFAGIYWLKNRNILEGLCKVNEFVARDETLHAMFPSALYNILTVIDKKYPPLSEQRIHEIVDEATKVASTFVRDALQVDLVGLKADDMIDYIKCTANSIAASFGCSKLYNVTNPFDWMAVISLSNKSNFFETRVSEYGRQAEADFDFDLDADF